MTAGDIVRLAIVLSVVVSFESVHFQQDDLLDAVRLIYAAKLVFFRLEHNTCIKSTSTMLNPGRSAA